MAVDTRNKRASAIAIGLPFGRSFPLADGSLADAGDRQHIAYCYAGIAADPATVAADLLIERTVMMRTGILATLAMPTTIHATVSMPTTIHATVQCPEYQ